jgi:hypothetical protein
MSSPSYGTSKPQHYFRQAFLRHAPRRYALMLTLEEAQRRSQKYDERQGEITDAMICRHLTGQVALAVPAAVGGLAHLLPLDVDGGGILAIYRLIEAAHAHSLWAFGQYCPRPSLDEQEQRGYVWLVFEELADAAQLQLLGKQLIASVARPGWKIEPRAHAAVTRLPLARHMHTGRFGELVFFDRTCSIDGDPAGALVLLRQNERENSVGSLPMPPLPASDPQPECRKATSSEPGITIDRYNQDNDLIALLESYGATSARGSRRLMHCCGHQDSRRASLLLWKSPSAKLYCRCLSEHHDCPLAGQVRDAFGVYCAMERLTAEDALRRLNGREAARWA